MKFEGPEQPPTEEQNSQLKSGLLGKLKERLSGGALTRRKKTIAAEALEDWEAAMYKDIKGYLKREQREISKPVIEEARTMRNRLLEARGVFSMSKADFDTYFSSSEFEVRADLKQQNIGDCYIIAAIHAMSTSPHFEMICRSSMKRLPDGSWQVRIPLMSEEGEIITVTPEEILPQRNKQFLRRTKKGKILPDLRRKLRLAKGKEGLQVLEAAFIKAKFGSLDVSSAGEGGWSTEVLLLLGGDNFREYSVNLNTRNKGKKMAYLDHYLENFDPEIHIATAATEHKTSEFFRIRGTRKYLISGHAYSISSVDSQRKVVVLANPWDTSRPTELTFDQFKENFPNFLAVRIDSARLLKNMKSVVERKAS